jgi:hypothetical protein
LERSLVDENELAECGGGEELGVAPASSEPCVVICSLDFVAYHSIAAPRLVPMADMEPSAKLK